ncbi:hypothetical protein [Escherichia coli]|uniref:hypothetical protein n=1 Tax=Escherichia coli TaxID=562 RepID=UPI00201CD51F|nr:hypothetical protein [Escherichia coli]
MAKRKNNVVKKIGDSASLLSKPKSILRRKDFKELVTLTKQNSAPGEWKTEIIEHSPSVPCGDEYIALQEILSSTPGVFWKPKKRKEYIVDSSDLRKYQILGFEDYWICPYISRHLLSLNPLQARCRRYSRGER